MCNLMYLKLSNNQLKSILHDENNISQLEQLI